MAADRHIGQSVLTAPAAPRETHAVPVMLRECRLIPRYRNSRAYYLITQPDGTHVSTHRLGRGHQWWLWEPALDEWVRHRGAEMTSTRDDPWVAVDCDTGIARGGCMWIDGFRLLMDMAVRRGAVPDITDWLAVRTPGHAESRHGQGWQFWFPEPAGGVRLGPLPLCDHIEIKRFCTAPGSPGYVVRNEPPHRPVFPDWLLEIAGRPVAGERTRMGASDTMPTWDVLERFELNSIPDPAPDDDGNDISTGVDWEHEQQERADREQLRLERARRKARKRCDADEMLNDGMPELDTATISLADAMSAPPPARRWAVDRLASAGSMVTLPSRRKTGKTTFLANLARAGVDGGLFLGEFLTYLESGRTVAVVNCEMSAPDYDAVYRPLGIGATERIVFLHLREHGIKLNLLNDLVAERFTAWLAKHNAGWLFLDPWKNIASAARVGLNDNDGVNLLTARIQEIHASAGLGLTVIPMHVTQAAGSAERGTEQRGKGAGELEDSADALWRYTRTGSDTQRTLTVEGRGGAALPETVVQWDELTGSLTLGTGTRADAKTASAKTMVEQAIHTACLAGKPLNSGELREKVGLAGTTVDAARNELESEKLIHSVRKGNAILWYAGPPVSSGPSRPV